MGVQGIAWQTRGQRLGNRGRGPRLIVFVLVHGASSRVPYTDPKRSGHEGEDDIGFDIARKRAHDWQSTHELVDMSDRTGHGSH